MIVVIVVAMNRAIDGAYGAKTAINVSGMILAAFITLCATFVPKIASAYGRWTSAKKENENIRLEMSSSKGQEAAGMPLKGGGGI
jgi:uncharacterized protein involved in tolerance to divalent cations